MSCLSSNGYDDDDLLDRKTDDKSTYLHGSLEKKFDEP